MSTDGNCGTNPVVGYVRSAKESDPQLDEWEAQIRAYAAERGYNLIAVVREEGVGGTAEHRPALELLIRELTENQYVGVIVPYLSHFGVGETAKKAYTIITLNAWVECSDQP